MRFFGQFSNTVHAFYLFSRSGSTIETNTSFGPGESHAFIQVRIIAVNGNGSTSRVKIMVLKKKKKCSLVSSSDNFFCCKDSCYRSSLLISFYFLIMTLRKWQKTQRLKMTKNNLSFLAFLMNFCHIKNSMKAISSVCSHWHFFYQFWSDLKLICLVTLFDCKLYLPNSHFLAFLMKF